MVAKLKQVLFVQVQVWVLGIVGTESHDFFTSSYDFFLS